MAFFQAPWTSGAWPTLDQSIQASWNIAPSQGHTAVCLGRLPDWPHKAMSSASGGSGARGTERPSPGGLASASGVGLPCAVVCQDVWGVWESEATFLDLYWRSTFYYVNYLKGEWRKPEWRALGARGCRCKVITVMSGHQGLVLSATEALTGKHTSALPSGYVCGTRAHLSSLLSVVASAPEPSSSAPGASVP